MTITRLIEPHYSTNVYLLEHQDAALVIDPALEYREVARRTTAQIGAVLVTHGHWDHLAALESYLAEGVPVYISEEAASLAASPGNVSWFWHEPYETVSVREAKKVLLRKDEEFIIGPFSFFALKTPGHTAGSFCFLFGEELFTGDTLFKGAVGRADLPTGNAAQLAESLAKLAKLPPQLRIHPGHGAPSYLADELTENEYLQNALQARQS